MKGFFVTGTDTDVGKTWFMLKFGELLIENNIKLIPSYGTLLGLIRDQEIIKHEYDIDLFLFEEDWLKLKKIMKENNRNKIKEKIGIWDNNYEIYEEKTG